MREILPRTITFTITYNDFLLLFLFNEKKYVKLNNEKIFELYRDYYYYVLVERKIKQNYYKTCFYIYYK